MVGQLLQRDERLLLVLSEGSPAWDLYRLRWRDALADFSAGDRIAVETVTHTDHVFTLLWTQDRLCTIVTDWLKHAEA